MVFSRNLFLTSVIIFIIALGCSEKSEKKVIPQKDFIPILVDIHLMDAMLANSDFMDKLAKKDSTDYYKTLINQHGYTKTQFDSSITYYSNDLKKFDKIYQEVLARLSKMETKVQEKAKEEKEMKAKEKEKAREDSVKSKEEMKPEKDQMM